MSPLGKPDPETGEVVRASRHYKGATLGAVGEWTCPACGVKNTTEFVQGCPACGAGKPGEARTPQPPVKPGHTRGASPQGPRPAQPADRSQPKPPGDLSMRPAAPPSTGFPKGGVPEGAVRVVRLIEYLIAPGKLEAGQLTLRRALVGTTGFDWGQITATIVDSVDARQEDLLRVAKLQPGVWLGGPTADRSAGQSIAEVVENMLKRPPAPKPTVTVSAEPPPPAAEPAPAPDPPDVGITVSAEYAEHAAAFLEQWGYRFANTVALALSAIAEELRGNMEPRKFLTADECLEFAQALMNAIPDDWEGDLELEEEQTDEATS